MEEEEEVCVPSRKRLLLCVCRVGVVFVEMGSFWAGHDGGGLFMGAGQSSDHTRTKNSDA